MKKVIICTCIATVVFIICLCLICFKSPKSNVAIQYSDTDNSYYNSLSNSDVSLIQIKDKLYYNYLNSDGINYGTYEITANNLQRVHWNGLTFHPKNISLNDVYNQKIYEDNCGNYYWDFDENTLKEDKNMPVCKYNSDGTAAELRLFCNNSIYFYSDDALYKWVNNQKQLIVSRKQLGLSEDVNIMDTVCLFDRYIDYIKTEGSACFCRYDTKEKKIINQIEFTNISNLSKRAGNAVFSGIDEAYYVDGNESVYRFDLKNQSWVQIAKTNGQIFANYYNHTLYYSVDYDDNNNGFYSLNYQKQKTPKKLLEHGTSGIYILDDKYLYFTDDRENLFRTDTDGKEAEEVFVR